MSLACLYMMMECPRCGFSQPQDRYCASCGLDIEQFLRKPKPLWIRLAQNPNLHLSLIGILIVLVIAYLFNAQHGLVARRMNALLKGTPLSSREAEVPSEESQTPKAPSPPATAPAPVAAQAAVATTSAHEAKAAVGAEAPARPQKIEVSYWEIGREDLNNLLSSADKVGESNAGRAYVWTNENAKTTADTVQSKARRISVSRTAPAVNGAQITVETPPTSNEAFQFGLYFQMGRSPKLGRMEVGAGEAHPDPHEINIKWDSTLITPQGEATEPVGSAPAVKALTETHMNGAASLTVGSVLMLVFEPPNRAPRLDYVARAGDGPWTVFNSDAFRAGASDWIALVQVK